MFNFFYNSNIFIWIEKLINFINSIFFILLLVALSFALIFSPPDYLQGDSVRIMYVHVPAAWIGLASFSTLALLSIFIFGGEILKGFSRAMILGVIFGTYSSIYIANPTLVYLNVSYRTVVKEENN